MLMLWRLDVTGAFALHVLTFDLILSGCTGRTGGDPAQSPWHRRRGRSRCPWRQGWRGTKGIHCSQITWYLRGRRQKIFGGESIGAQASERRCAVPHQHPQKPFWQDPTTGTKRLIMNMACVTNNNSSSTNCCRPFRLLQPTYDQCVVCLLSKQKDFETSLPLI